jgi:hypothetical protein
LAYDGITPEIMVKVEIKNESVEETITAFKTAYIALLDTSIAHDGRGNAFIEGVSRAKQLLQEVDYILEV